LSRLDPHLTQLKFKVLLVVPRVGHLRNYHDVSLVGPEPNLAHDIRGLVKLAQGAVLDPDVLRDTHKPILSLEEVGSNEPIDRDSRFQKKIDSLFETIGFNVVNGDDASVDDGLSAGHAGLVGH
jgi:hypothetical protein